MKLTNNDVGLNFQECLANDYTDQASIIKDAYTYCFLNDDSHDDAYDNDSYISWKKSAEQRMKEIARNFSINFEDYQATPGAHEIPIVVAMTFKTFLCLESGKGQAGSYLKNGQFEKISHKDKESIINTTMDFLLKQYKDIPDAKGQIEESKTILLDYEKYEQDKEVACKRTTENIKDFIFEELEQYFNKVKIEVGEYVDEDDHTHIWATLPKRHPEILSIAAKRVLLSRFDYYISQAIERWKHVVSLYANRYSADQVENCVSDKEKEKIISRLIEEAEKEFYSDK